MELTEQQRKELEHQRDLERLKSLRPIDDDFMRCMFKDNIPLAQLTLRIITQKDDLEIISLETQRDDSGAGVHRARYHSSAMDVENLSAGQEFSELPDTYTIFITENDVFSKGKALYRIERYNIDTEDFFNDGQHILYVNGEYRDDSDIGRLMHDFNCSDPNEMYFELFKITSRHFKESQEGVNTMCRAFEEMRNETRNATKIEMQLDFAKKLLAYGKMTLEEISQMTDLSVNDLRKLQEAGA